jgi:hypothetical protein
VTAIKWSHRYSELPSIFLSFFPPTYKNRREDVATTSGMPAHTWQVPVKLHGALSIWKSWKLLNWSKVLYEIQRLITRLIRICHWTVTSTSWISSTASLPTYLRLILVLTSQLHLRPLRAVLQNFHKHFSSSIHISLMSEHPTDILTLLISGKDMLNIKDKDAEYH